MEKEILIRYILKNKCIFFPNKSYFPHSRGGPSSWDIPKHQKFKERGDEGKTDGKSQRVEKNKSFAFFPTVLCISVCRVDDVACAD